MLDNSIYFKQRGAANLMDGAQQGFTFGQMIKRNRQQNQDRKKQAKLRELVSSGVSFGEDGSISADSTTLGQIAGLDPSKAREIAGQLNQQNQRKSSMERDETRYQDSRQDRMSDEAFREKKLKEERLFKKAKQAFEERKLAAMGSKKPASSEFQKVMDREAAKKLADYQVGGGKSIVDTNIERFEGAIKSLEEDGDLSGGITGYTGEWSQDMFNSDMATVRDDIRTAIQGSLKPILGAQFTEKEAEAIFSRAFNPRLSDKENVRRAKLELNNIKSIAANKEAALDHFRKHNTLAGFKPMETLKDEPTPGDNTLKDMNKSMVVEKNPNKGPMESILPSANAAYVPPLKHPQRNEALEWAKKNPNDPRAKETLRRLGGN